jgi:branched-chain amino acid transport system ATP-binding protein
MTDSIKHSKAVIKGSKRGPLLSVNQVTKTFDTVTALKNLSFDVHHNEVFGIAGPNGAGKSTTLNVCSGLLSPTSGEIIFRGERVEGLAPYRMCDRGLGRTFQIPQVFGTLTVEENVRIGKDFGANRTDPSDLYFKKIEELLDITGLLKHKDEIAGSVDLLTRKMVMLASVLATNPKLVFMDEPFAGLNPDEIEIFAALIRQLHNELGLSFVVVEHKIRALSSLSNRLMIIHFGSSIIIDVPEVVVKDKRVIDVYLGMEYNA